MPVTRKRVLAACPGSCSSTRGAPRPPAPRPSQAPRPQARPGQCPSTHPGAFPGPPGSAGWGRVCGTQHAPHAGASALTEPLFHPYHEASATVSPSPHPEGPTHSHGPLGAARLHHTHGLQPRLGLGKLSQLGPHSALGGGVGMRHWWVKVNGRVPEWAPMSGFPQADWPGPSLELPTGGAVGAGSGWGLGEWGHGWARQGNRMCRGRLTA